MSPSQFSAWTTIRLMMKVITKLIIGGSTLPSVWLVIMELCSTEKTRCPTPHLGQHKLSVSVNVFLVAPQDGLSKSDMEKLTFYAVSAPEKLDRIGAYLAERLSRDVVRHRYGWANTSRLCRSATSTRVTSFLRSNGWKLQPREHVNHRIWPHSHQLNPGSDPNSETAEFVQLKTGEHTLEQK